MSASFLTRMGRDEQHTELEGDNMRPLPLLDAVTAHYALGCWCDFITVNSETAALGVLRYINWHSKEAVLWRPDEGYSCWVHLENVTPRFDLPRAWTPNGTPPTPRNLQELEDLLSYAPATQPQP